VSEIVAAFHARFRDEAAMIYGTRGVGLDPHLELEAWYTITLDIVAPVVTRSPRSATKNLTKCQDRFLLSIQTQCFAKYIGRFQMCHLNLGVLLRVVCSCSCLLILAGSTRKYAVVPK
jgi:hypothetical protein